VSRFHLPSPNLFYTLLALALLAPACAAQFKVTDNFNRPDGPVGLGWSTFGNGAQISGDQLKTFGKVDFGGGIQRNLDVSFPLRFSFDFSTTSPSNGGWVIGFNAAGAGFDPDNDTSEVVLYQSSGSRQLCVEFQTSSGPVTQCASLADGQRDYTAKAMVTGRLNSDFSATVTITYNDSLQPGEVTIRSPAPTGAKQTALGSVFFFGSINAIYAPDYFDNFTLVLM
jgi:hypothetical protein